MLPSRGGVMGRWYVWSWWDGHSGGGFPYKKERGAHPDPVLWVWLEIFYHF